MKFESGEIVVSLAGAAVLLVGVPAAIVLTHASFPAEFMTSPKAALVIGALSSATGLGLFFWSCYELITRGRGGPAVLGKLKLTRETRFLVTTGPYSICRNPMHLGLILYYFGLSCALNALSGLLIAVAFGVFAGLLAVFADEPRLKRDFGRDYEEWAARVPRFIPGTRRASASGTSAGSGKFSGKSGKSGTSGKSGVSGTSGTSVRSGTSGKKKQQP